MEVIAHFFPLFIDSVMTVLREYDQKTISMPGVHEINQPPRGWCLPVDVSYPHVRQGLTETMITSWIPGIYSLISTALKPNKPRLKFDYRYIRRMKYPLIIIIRAFIENTPQWTTRGYTAQSIRNVVRFLRGKVTCSDLSGQAAPYMMTCLAYPWTPLEAWSPGCVLDGTYCNTKRSRKSLKHET